MADMLSPARVGFFERVRTPRWLARFAAEWPRYGLAALLASVPALAVLLAIALGPEGLRVSATDPASVRETFGRFIGAVVTAASIAVSVAVLTLKTELKGLHRLADEEEENRDFREELRDAIGERTASIVLPEIAAETLDGIADKARELRRVARAHLEDGRASEVEDFLDVAAERASEVARKVRACCERPDRFHLAFLDMEHEVLSACARRYGRDESVPTPVRSGMRDLYELLRRSQALERYTKTLDMEWGLGRMSLAILATSIPAVLVAAFMTLLYGPGAPAALGTLGAAALVCAALALILLPFAVFVSFLVRFVFLNQHTLATHGLLLGPEEPGARRTRARRRTGARA